MNSGDETGNVYYTIFLGFFVLTIILFASSENYAFAAPPSLGDMGITSILPTNGGTERTDTLTLSDVTTGASANRLLVVSVAIDHSKTVDETITSVTFGPDGTTCSLVAPLSLTLVPGTTSTSASSFNQIYSLVAPPASEVCDVTVTLTGDVGGGPLHFGSSTAASANYAMFSGVDQTTPIDNTLTTQSTATSLTPSASIVTISDHFVYDIMSTASITVIVPTFDPSQTLLQAFRVTGGAFSTAFAMGSSYQLGATDTSMDWTLSASVPWDISAIAIRSVDLPPVSPSDSKKGGSCNDCTPPTLGVSESGKIFVDNGFRYNDYTTNVNLFHTPFPLITVNVGDENIAELKIYENSGTQDLKHVTLGFGLTENNIISNSAAKIEIDFDYDGSHTVSVFDPENSLENIRTEIDIVNCMDTSQYQCVLIKIYHTFRAPLEFNIVSTDVWDMHRNSWQNYYNHGIHVVGDSLNAPKTTLIASGTNDMRGLFQLTQIDHINHLWIDDFGSTYVNMGNNRFDRISQPINEKQYDSPTSHGCDRNCNWFDAYKIEQQLIAEDTLRQILQNKDIVGTLNDPISIYISKVSRSENMELQNSIENEISTSAQLAENLYYSSEKPIQNFE